MRSKLRDFLKGKVAIVGIGNMLKGDDQAGPVLVQRLKGKTKAFLFDCGEVPENYAQPIVKSSPDTILIIDAADWQAEAGNIKLIEPKEVVNFGFSTHNASLRFFFDYLKKELPQVNIALVGIQIGQKGLGNPLSKEVELAVDNLVSILSDSGLS